MANPNINAATAVFAVNAFASLTSTSAVQIVSNAASSNKVYLVDGLVVANLSTATTVTVTISRYTAATNTGAAFEIANAITVPAAASLVVIDRSSGVNLTEAQSIYASAGSTAAGIKVTADWKELS
jgi:hypothetical protein